MANDVERIARIMNSNTQLPLSPYEKSLVVKELAGFNLSPDEIAALVGKSRARSISCWPSAKQITTFRLLLERGLSLLMLL